MTYHSVKKRNLRSMGTFLFIFGLVLITLYFLPILKDEIWYYIKELKGQVYQIDIGENIKANSQKDSVFARFVSTKPVVMTPVNKEFSMIIEKIGLNAPIVADVLVTNEEVYNKALKNGVAHASSSEYPSNEPGNVYLFAHASMNFWTLGKYATVFNLLGKLMPGDRIHIFYQGDTYVYSVMNKEIHKGWDTYPITRAVIEPTLTIQTCDPPGTTINRLVVTAKLLEVVEANN